jgi:hypothetical protein
MKQHERMAKSVEQLTELTKVVRASFAQQPHLAEGLLSDLGINSETREILEYIAKSPGQTVLMIADHFSKSAVDIQRCADSLKKLGMTSYVWANADDPTPSLSLEEKGRVSLNEVRRRERTLVAEIAKDFQQMPISEFKVSVILGNIARELSAEPSQA